MSDDKIDSLDPIPKYKKSNPINIPPKKQVLNVPLKKQTAPIPTLVKKQTNFNKSN